MALTNTPLQRINYAKGPFRPQRGPPSFHAAATMALIDIITVYAHGLFGEEEMAAAAVSQYIFS